MSEKEKSHTDMNCNGEIPIYPSYKNGESVPCLTEKERNESNHKGKKARQVEMTVHITDGNKCCTDKWTSRERYLFCACTLLFTACLVFIAVAFFRSRIDNIYGDNSAIQAMDTSVEPCEDFFQFACGNWNKRNMIPEDKPSFNTFEKLHDDLQIKLKGLLEEQFAVKDNKAIKKAKVLYRSCMNISQIENIGEAPLRTMISKIGGFPVLDPSWSESSFSLEDMLGIIRGQYNTPVVMYSNVGADDKKSTSNIIQLDQPELGLPSRHYYLDDQNSSFVRSYLKYMKDIAVLLGADELRARKEMEDVLKFETMLANVTTPDNERHDTGLLYRKMTIQALQALVPQFDWLKYFTHFIPFNLDEKENIVTYAPEYLVKMMGVIQNTDKRTVANYIVIRTIFVFVPELTEKFRAARREYRRVSEGISRDIPRWQKCVEYANKKLGVIVGAMFVKDNFQKKSKDTALSMIHNIRAAFNELLHENAWMDHKTREVAMEKLFIDERTYFENVLRLELFEAKNAMKKLREPVDKDQWEQDPAVVNAFYNPNTNDIVFPAGILQPPFYSDVFPKSLNYGGIGVVIGHEITHGFDDKGRQYDKFGNLKQWWDNGTINAFRHRAQCMIDQYSSYKLDQIGLNIDGKNTQGENIADNGGLKQAYRAYSKWVERHGEELLLPGLKLSNRQLFFLNYAQIWCGNMRDEEALEKIRTSVHSPGSIRVLGPLSNSEDFAEVYQCPKGSRMNPIHKCSVW
ncbi:hypothetical protein FSP39_004964 [Pinctada imbricata]|uniref:Endothelin-converting enzyme 1 n=1 Tax=Pinctada imbricata TaxID=66713 RepID=A0AA89C3M2_PINIB|nr:hypothetical protein FSP39_004964 [Pinctada imbricata]